MRKLFHTKFDNLHWLWLALGVVIIDQITKYAVMHYLSFRGIIKVLPFFNFYFNYNTGAAFSLLASGSGWQEWLFACLAILVSGGIVYWLYTAPKTGGKWLKTSLMLILGGAVGNLLDRVFLGRVRDFLDFHWGIYHWPTFNLADTAICIGALIMAWYFWKHSEEL